MTNYQTAFHLKRPFETTGVDEAKFYIEYMDGGTPRSYKSKIPIFNESGVQEHTFVYDKYIRLYEVSTNFDADMLKMNFYQCLNDKARENWEEVVDKGDNDGNNFDVNKDGFLLAVKYLIMKNYMDDDPNPLSTMLEGIIAGRLNKPWDMMFKDFSKRYKCLSSRFKYQTFDDPPDEDKIKDHYLKTFPGEWEDDYRMHHDYRMDTMNQITT